MSEDSNQDNFTISGDYNSQPLFTDVQNVASPASIADDIDGIIENSQDDTDRSQSLILPQINHHKRKYFTEKVMKEEENTQYSDESNKKKKEIEHTVDEVTANNLCIHCYCQKELDKRNYYFGNLLIGELQYLPPCMRSEAYINILNYVQSLKHKHTKQYIFPKNT